MGDIVKIPPKTDDITYFYLIEKNTVQTDAQEEKGKLGITKLVAQEGGKCRLFKTSGSAFDFISIVTGISTASAIKIAGEINKQGDVRATMVPGIEAFHRK